ncbi:MAG: hypothetical protein JXD19_00955 [Deltaproteobacteria bacterium]|nr:hypothetical protein [Deltaproteobacteria bacterium]
MGKRSPSSGLDSGESGVLQELKGPPDDPVLRMGIDRHSPDALLETLPFTLGDTTVGTESELQALVIGSQWDVDLPLLIEQSNYYANIVRRAASGDTPRRAVADLEKYLNENPDTIWENSWVRVPCKALSPAAESIFHKDLLADKKSRSAGLRSDADRFSFVKNGEKYLRIPISYLLKLALADVISAASDMPQAIRDAGMDLLNHFLSDNTSPETHSFYVGLMERSEGMGKMVAAESAIRFLLTQLLITWANEKFLLRRMGQRAMVYLSPNPPVRQKRLNESISDTFYRDLIMNPCLSGWDNGEAKHAYMHLCHEVLSRSQLNAVKKLREAGILTNNLAVLPNLSNISLANNGTHVSLGSRKLTALLADNGSGFTHLHEKYLGDLVIKIVEHFMPLFVGTYSAAPYRIDFAEFHPEKVLGFLPHELDYTHLRMFWRRWKKKAKIKVFGRPLTPFGPQWLDRLIGKTFNLSGDFIPDFRLIDYPVSFMSTERSPALNGMIGNSSRLKKDLADLGVFSTKMSLYLLYKLREQAVMGFSGFEGRQYSLFESFGEDMAAAVDVQNLVTALAMKYIVEGRVAHAHIPDSPLIESERRQVVFGAAVGIPTFFVRRDTLNQFLLRIISRTRRLRPSRRYPGYLRVYNREYRRTLIDILREDAADLIDMMQMRQTVDDLLQRVNEPEKYSVEGKCTRGICRHAGIRSPFDLDGDEFNHAAESYYRENLRNRHMAEAFELMMKDHILADHRGIHIHAPAVYRARKVILGGQPPLDFLARVKKDAMEERLPLETLQRLIFIVVAHIALRKAEKKSIHNQEVTEKHDSRICRAGNE